MVGYVGMGLFCVAESGRVVEQLLAKKKILPANKRYWKRIVVLMSLIS